MVRCVDDLTERYVKPFYLDMMGVNALSQAEEHIPALQRLGPTLDPADLIRLLRGQWRPRVMGAWFALFHAPSTVGDEVLRSLETAAGSLTAPPLATVAVYLLDTTAIPSLATYASSAVASQDGSGRFIAAALEHLDAVPGAGNVLGDDRAAFAAMLAFAGRLDSP